MKKMNNTKKIRVNADKYAQELFRANGNPKAQQIAKSCMESAPNASCKGFWTQVLALVSK